VGKVALAIDAYDNALATHVSQQEGIILLMRASAYLQLVATHKRQLEEIVNELIGMVLDMTSFQSLYEETSSHPAITNSVFRRVLEHTATQEKQFRRTQYRHGLYQYALLQAAQDSLRATQQLMPTHATSWVQAGEILSELWKLKESGQYYERAIELDATLTDSLVPVFARMRKRQELLDNARAYGWSEDTIRLALNVAR
jgi:tetratricopeptide (TPR) repeat protein